MKASEIKVLPEKVIPENFYPEQQTDEVPVMKNLELLNINEAAEYLRVSKHVVYKLIEERKIPFCRMTGGKRVILRKNDLFEWLGKNLVMPAEVRK